MSLQSGRRFFGEWNRRENWVSSNLSALWQLPKKVIKALRLCEFSNAIKPSDKSFKYWQDRTAIVCTRALLSAWENLRRPLPDISRNGNCMIYHHERKSGCESFGFIYVNWFRTNSTIIVIIQDSSKFESGNENCREMNARMFEWSSSSRAFLTRAGMGAVNGNHLMERSNWMEHAECFWLTHHQRTSDLKPPNFLLVIFRIVIASWGWWQ